jgi:signal transduction histidine kinase/DNA-binding response OmpR family regulator
MMPSLGRAEQGQEVAEFDTLAACYNALATELNRRIEEIIGLQAKLEAHNEALNAHNEELALLSAQAQASNRLKSEFLANMSHELRTPLNSIIGYTELVLTEEGLDLDPQSRQNLEIVQRNARHLLALINDILDLSKIEAGRLSVYPEPFDAQAVLEAVVAMTRPMAEQKHLGLRLSLAPGLGPIVSDETKVRQIVLNLVTNAIKFTESGDVNISLVPMGATRWAVVVSDSGIGIAPEYQALVFEEFRQVDQGSTRAAGGTGLGLSIARKLARLLQGDLTLESAPGRGSTFTLELPRKLAVASVPSGPAPGEASVVDAPADNTDVVVIDDDPLSLHLTAEKLKGTAYHVIPAATPDDGIAQVGARRPYAVILDVKMRRVDDWKLLRALKGDPGTSSVPVIVASFDENKPLAYSLGAAACLRKPLETPALLGALDGLREASMTSAGTALVLGEEADALDVYVRVLRDARYEVAVVRDGDAALEHVRRATPALLVADLPMNLSDPLPFLDHWRQDPVLRERPALIVMGSELSRESMTRLPRFRQILPKIKLSPELLSNSLRALLSQLRSPIA